MPTIHMTKSAVDALKAASKDTVYWDAGLPGFGVKVTPRGRKVFVVLYDMTPADENTLDRWEGSELGIHKKIRCRVERVASNRRVLGPDGKVQYVRYSASTIEAARAAPGRM